jgi:oxygen-independent coproporphyrinogen-3 oxidase
MTTSIPAALLQKYDVPLPRYTSYPTVPYWNFASLSPQHWLKMVKQQFEVEAHAIAVYIHLPFCEELCTYCACNKRITKNHQVERPYLEAVLKEWDMYVQVLGAPPVVRELHLGGGTPTFFSPEHLKELVQGIMARSIAVPDAVFSVEVHPNFTSDDHLAALREVGFNRISVGVQDFDPKVQFVINRMQSFDSTQHVVNKARALGFTSVNIDLVYGLPLQDVESVANTISKVEVMRPDRIAFYSYAHVPWKSKAQRRYTDADVPGAEAKRAMFTYGKSRLEAMGYHAIGMDHFALPDDELHRSYAAGKLHRNFMGYTQSPSKLLIGLGASSISDAWMAFAQNEKEVEAYQEKINRGEWPWINWHLLHAEDLRRRQLIMDLMCNGEALVPEDLLNAALPSLQSLQADGLIVVDQQQVNVTETGRALIRNVCASFDQYFTPSGQDKPVFSKAI